MLWILGYAILKCCLVSVDYTLKLLKRKSEEEKNSTIMFNICMSIVCNRVCCAENENRFCFSFGFTWNL